MPRSLEGAHEQRDIAPPLLELHDNLPVESLARFHREYIDDALDLQPDAPSETIQQLANHLERILVLTSEAIERDPHGLYARRMQRGVELLIAHFGELHPILQRIVEPYLPAETTVPSQPKESVRRSLSTEAQIAERLSCTPPRLMPESLRKEFDELKVSDPQAIRDQISKKIERFELARKQIIPLLVEDRLVQYESPSNPETSRLILNVRTFKTALFGPLRDKLGMGGKENVGLFQIDQMLMAAFDGHMVIDSEDPNRTAKKLFFTANTPADVLDLKKLQEAKFHLGAWELLSATKWQHERYPLTDPNDQPPLTPQLVAFAVTLFNRQKKYASAVRNPRDQSLELLDVDHSVVEGTTTPQRYEFSAEGFVEHFNLNLGGKTDKGSTDKPNKQLRFASKPLPFALKYFQSLFDHGLLRTSDFRIQAGSSTAEVAGPEHQATGRSGAVAVGGDVYYFGAQASREGWIGSALSQEYGIAYVETPEGTVDQKALFHLISPEERRDRPRANKTGKGAAISKGFLEQNLRVDTNAESLFRELPNETPAQFAERTAAYEAYTLFPTEHQLLKQLPKLWRELGKGSNGRRQQILAASAIKHLLDIGYDPEHLNKYYISCGLNGLKALQVTEYGQELGKMVVEIGLEFTGSPNNDSNSGETVAQTLFKTYNAIVNQINEAVVHLRTEFGTEAVEKPAVLKRVQVILFDRAKQLLKRFDTRRGNPSSILTELQRVEASTHLILATNQSIHQENPNLALEFVGGVKTEIYAGAAIPNEKPQDFKAQMLRIFDQNWAANPDVAPLAREQLKAGLARADNQFYLMVSGNNVLGYTRLDLDEHGRLNHRHAGSLNIDDHYKQYGLADVLMTLVKKQIDEAGIIVDSNADPQNEELPSYLRRHGRAITGLVWQRTDPKKPLFPLFVLVGDKGANDGYWFPQQPVEEIKKLYSGRNDAYGPDDKQIVQRFNMKIEYAVMLAQAKKILDTGRYALTAYQKDPTDPSNIYLAFETLRSSESSLE